ncbi:MAG: aminopeptidase P family protein [Chlorobiales bacterium]|nr:aminopeptidase P family protein [Chlorobiales bacterium]
MLHRLEPLLKKMSRMDIDTFMVSDLHVIRWLTGFSGSNARVLLSPEKNLLFTDFRYGEQVKQEVDSMESVIMQNGFSESFVEGGYLQGKRLGIQAEQVTVHDAGKLEEKLEGVEIVPVNGFFDEFRAIKNDQEITWMKKAAAISEQVLEEILPLISPEVTEAEIAAEISYRQKRLGAERDSFDPVVASGARSALPHARPGTEQFRPGTLIVIDMGCVYKGYASDQTRTFAFGRVPEEARKIYEITRDAQQLGIDWARPGVSAKDLDSLVRDYIGKHGYAEYFGHGLGHGVGIEVHEKPRLGKTSEDHLLLHSVFTIEPGIYLPGKFGVRIEDTVVMGDHGVEPFQRFTKELIEL